MTRFLVVPQWQGSPSSRAMLLVDGAQAIAGDLPRRSCTSVDVPMEAGESVQTGVRRYSALRRINAQVREALAAHDEPVLTVGGDCGTAVAAVAHAAERCERLAVVWLDAHADLHTPDTSPSGAFSGMALRAVLGEGADALTVPAGQVRPERVVLVGARDIDDAEADALATLPIAVVEAGALEDPDTLARAVAATDADAVYVHIDLDVLDPAVIAGVSAAVPFGAEVSPIVGAVRRLRETIPLAGSGIAGFAPAAPAAAVDDLGAILRLVGALA